MKNAPKAEWRKTTLRVTQVSVHELTGETLVRVTPYRGNRRRNLRLGFGANHGWRGAESVESLEATAYLPANPALGAGIKVVISFLFVPPVDVVLNYDPGLNMTSELRWVVSRSGQIMTFDYKPTAVIAELGLTLAELAIKTATK